MANLSGIVTPDTILALPALSPFLRPCFPAGNLITGIRRQIPDPTYTNIGGVLVQDAVINPDHDGQDFEAAAMYDWLTDGMSELVRQTNWLLDDWFAFPAQASQPTYLLDYKWHQVSSAYAYQFRCWPLPEEWTLFPSQAVTQPGFYGWHRRGEAGEVFFYPNPNRTDPVTFLAQPIGATTDTIVLQDTTNFLSFGWVLVESELIQYASLNATTNTLSVTRRGCSGTIATAHLDLVPAQSCSLWVNGKRIPRPVTRAADCLEIPAAFLAPLRLYVRAQVKGAEQDDAAEERLMGRFLQACDSIKKDPIWQANLRDGSAQVAMYGGGGPGPLVYGGPFGYYLP